MSEQKRVRPSNQQVIDAVENSVHLARVAAMMGAQVEIRTKNLDLDDMARMYKVAITTICAMADYYNTTADQFTTIFKAFRIAEGMRKQ